MLYLVSYPHSGNTWFRYCIEYVTGLPTHGHKAFSISQRARNILNIDIDANPIALKRHKLKLNEIKKDDIFVLLLRSPFDCIKHFTNENVEFLNYYALIEYYEQHKGIKYNFNYSNLFIKDCMIAYFELLRYHIPINDEKAFDLFYNWEAHQYQSKILYQNNTNQKGSELKNIPEILLNHPLIQKCI